MRTAAILLFLWLCQYAVSQSLSRRTIDSSLNQIDTSWSFSKGKLYVINGIPFEGDAVDKKLTGYTIHDLVNISLLKCDRNIFFHCRDDIVLITLIYPQQKKVKRRLLSRAKSLMRKGLLMDTSSFPVLMIDHQRIEPFQRSSAIERLKPRKVFFMDVDTATVGRVSYGRSSKAPLIRIWTASERTERLR